MADLKVVVWNMEWMNDLFVPNNQPLAFRPDDEHPQHHPQATVKGRREQLSAVLDQLAPDIVVVVEGPNSIRELELFFKKDVKGTWKVALQHSKGQSQALGVAVRTDRRKFAKTPFKWTDTNNMPEFDPFQHDTDDDEVTETYTFERRPLLVEINPREGKNFRILGLHLKSKGIFAAYEWSKWWQIADANRRKLLAQATQLRLRYLDPYLATAPSQHVPLLVCGDINDGPGLDASEKRLFGSAVERLMGNVWKPELCLRNALFEALTPEDQARLDFKKIETTSFKDPIFNNTWHREWIDHILYTPKADGPWVTNAQVHKIMQSGNPIWQDFPHASDHFPISAMVKT